MTIRLRLTLSFLLVLVLLNVLRTLVGISSFRQGMEAEARREVTSRANAVIDYLTHLDADKRGSKPVDLLTWEDPDLAAFSDDGMLIELSTDDGRVLARSPNLPETSLLPNLDRGLYRVAVALPRSPQRTPSLLMSRVWLSIPRPSVLVHVAYPLAGLERAVNNQLFVEIAGGVLSLLLVLFVSYYMAGRALEPVKQLNREVEALTGLHKRLPIAPPPLDEIDQVAFTFNKLFDRLERLFEAQRRFVADASHELRTPLTAILAHVQLLERRGEAHPERAKAWLGTVREEVHRMSRIVEQLLLLARADAGEIEEEALVPVDLVRAARHAVDSLAPVHPRLQPFEGPVAAWIGGNGDRLTQLAINLIDNALRATQEGGTIRVAVEVTAREVLLRVADTGCGIPAEAMPHLFERFFRADPARDRGHGGSGLGLAICAAIVQAHGGIIEVASGVGEGTTFTARFPQATHEPKATTEPDEA